MAWIRINFFPLMNRSHQEVAIYTCTIKSICLMRDQFIYQSSLLSVKVFFWLR
jgi:hypothetical protein